MKKLLEAVGKSFYFQGTLSIGAFLTKNNRVILIDSGLDKADGQGIVKTLKDKKFILHSIINTHYHADHCGGNDYLQRNFASNFPEAKSPLKIFASALEKTFIENPFLEPTCFCGFAEPSPVLRSRHLEANPSSVTDPISPYKDTKVSIDEEEFQIITMPGHTHGMIGVITPDKVLYCGDAIFGEQTFNKHGVLFYTHIRDTLATLDKLEKLDISGCVLYHGGFVKDIKELIANHRRKIYTTKETVYKLIRENPGLSYDLLTQHLMNVFFIPKNPMMFTLTRTCAASYVSTLEYEHQCELFVTSGLLVARSNEIIAISHYKTNAGSPTEKTQTQIFFTFAGERKLVGNEALDSSLLSALRYLLNYMKHKAIIANNENVIKITDQSLSLYEGMKLAYDQSIFGDITSNNPKYTAQLNLQLSPNGFTLHFISPLPSKLLGELEEIFTNQFKLKKSSEEFSEKSSEEMKEKIPHVLTSPLLQ